MNRAFLESDHYAIDYRILLPDKTTIFICSLGQRWAATSGDSAECIGTAVDVTDQRWADEERRKLAAIVENSHDFIGFASLDGKPEILNPWGRKIIGLETEDQIRTTSLSDYVAEHQRELLIHEILPFVRRHGRWEGEMLFRSFKTGALIPMLQQIFLVVERETGRPTGLATISRDISLRKHAESAFRRSREYLAEAQRLSHTGSWAWNVSGGDLWWSDEHYRIMGLEPDGSRIPIGDALRLIHPDDLPFAQKELEESFKECRQFETRCRVVRPDGTVRHIQSVARPRFDETGKLNEYVGTIIDVTERLQSEQKLQTAQADLARMARITMIGEIGTAIVHEVNQPLSALVNDGEACFRWLSSEAPNLLEARAAAGRIVEQATRASEVVSRIQRFMAKSPPQISTINLNSVIEDVLNLLKYEITRFNIRVRTELQPNLYNVRGDAIQLKQVISNLIMNALEAMKSSDNRELTIESTNQQDVYAEAFVTVKDSGVGIDPAWADHLFKPFFTTKIQGVGIGLAISRSIIEAHGGQLRSVKATPGATFQFSLRAVV